MERHHRSGPEKTKRKKEKTKLSFDELEGSTAQANFQRIQNQASEVNFETYLNNFETFYLSTHIPAINLTFITLSQHSCINLNSFETFLPQTPFISLLMAPPSAVPSVIPQTGKQQLPRSLQIWIKSQTGPTHRTCLSIRTNLTLSLCLSERTV